MRLCENLLRGVGLLRARGLRYGDENLVDASIGALLKRPRYGDQHREGASTVTSAMGAEAAQHVLECHVPLRPSIGEAVGIELAGLCLL